MNLVANDREIYLRQYFLDNSVQGMWQFKPQILSSYGEPVKLFIRKYNFKYLI